MWIRIQNFSKCWIRTAYNEYGYATLQAISFILSKISATGKNIFRDTTNFLKIIIYTDVGTVPYSKDIKVKQEGKISHS